MPTSHGQLSIGVRKKSFILNPAFQIAASLVSIAGPVQRAVVARFQMWAACPHAAFLRRFARSGTEPASSAPQSRSDGRK